jgi:hypothetical protein
MDRPEPEHREKYKNSYRRGWTLKSETGKPFKSCKKELGTKTCTVFSLSTHFESGSDMTGRIIRR